ncbi:MAG: helix-turn-helix transcriptional regulator [Lachnospiraceae bacterium]|nr:helix-turn-helix transcriptional regulator [Lachnospiraceae bacterium]
MTVSKHARTPEATFIDRIYAETRVRDAGFVMPSYHCHNYFELFYVESGACRFLAEDHLYDLHAGDFMLIPPQFLHYTRYLFGACKRSTVFFRLEDLDPKMTALLPYDGQFLETLRLFQASLPFQETASGLLARMVAERETDDVLTEFLLPMQLQELLLLCSRNCRFLDDLPAEIPTTDRQILLAARFISEHYMEPITTADIAQAASFSPNYLTRKFREAAGIGVHEYLVYVRLKQAAKDLAATRDTITQIAFRNGFSDSNYFKDAFKKKYGLSPTQYRQNQC